MACRKGGVLSALTKHWSYLRYVARHKWFVFVAGLKTGAPIWRLVIHDWSKFLPSEWFPYAQHFYGDNQGEGLRAIGEFGLCELAPWGFYAKDRFTSAWNLHQKRNRHHWQFWLVVQDDGEAFPLPIPEKFLREMVADWAGAGRAIKGTWEVASWYEKNRGRMRLRVEDRARVEELVDLFGAKAPGLSAEAAV